MRAGWDGALHAAANLGVVPALRTLRARRFTHRHAAVLSRCIPDGMVLDGLELTVTDVAVGRAHAKGGTDRVIVKLARSSRGAASLRRASDGLAALRADARLDDWDIPRPEIVGSGELDGFPYVVESALPGVSIERLLRRGAAWQPFTALALDAIQGLHHRTAAPVRVDLPLLGRLIDGPVQAIKPLVAGSRRREAAVRELERELTARLTDATAVAGWIHGDFVPANVLFDPSAGTITGIVDWELAGTANLPALDRAMFVLAAQAQTTGREIGSLVAAIAAGQATESQRRPLSQAVWADHETSLDARTLVLLCWLGHIAAVVTQSERYARHPVWKRYNVYQVLDALGRGSRTKTSGTRAPSRPAS